MKKTKQDWRKEDLENVKQAIKDWHKNEGGMQRSYPNGLAQYLEESNYIYGSLCDFISELYSKGALANEC